jgi:1,4-dihydroxy-2-naphthoate octaprenyltransferase
MDVETSIQKKKKTAAWFSAMRLRTLPLALASTLTGAFLTLEQGAINGWVLLLTALTTIFLQVNSNLANDYGDFSHGTDNEGRVGPQRAMQSGAITEPEIRKAIILASSLSLISGVVLLLISSLEWGMRGVLFLFGIAAIYASIKDIVA